MPPSRLPIIGTIDAPGRKIRHHTYPLAGVPGYRHVRERGITDTFTYSAFGGGGVRPISPRCPAASLMCMCRTPRRHSQKHWRRATFPLQPKAANDRRTPKRLRRPRPGGRCSSLAGLTASRCCFGVVPAKAAAQPPLECGVYTPLLGLALRSRCSPKRRMIAALQSAAGARVLAESLVHSPV